MKTPLPSADRPDPKPAGSPSERDARRAAALRANLARRKAQARGRTGAGDGEGTSGGGPSGDDASGG